MTGNLNRGSIFDVVLLYLSTEFKAIFSKQISSEVYNVATTCYLGKWVGLCLVGFPQARIPSPLTPLWYCE